MESTGSYWKPVFNLLEAHVRVVLTNTADVQNRRGHKTDPNDSRWLAHLLRHGMIRPSFIPPLAIRELRDLTRRRRQLIGENSRERNRVDAGASLQNRFDHLFLQCGQAAGSELGILFYGLRRGTSQVCVSRRRVRLSFGVEPPISPRPLPVRT